MEEATSIGGSGLHWLSRQQSRRIDQLAIHRGISGEELMERAGSRCAEQILSRESPRTAWVFCGAGNNGGDGFVIARKLAERGVSVRLWLIGSRGKMSAETARNLDRWLKQSGRVETWPPRQVAGEAPDVAIDCLLGTGSSGNPRGALAESIRWINQLPCRRVAIDLPSGLDCDTGEAGEPTIRADRTLTMVGPKLGFREAVAAHWVGQWQVIELDVPEELIELATADDGKK